MGCLGYQPFYECLTMMQPETMSINLVKAEGQKFVKRVESLLVKS